MFISIKLRWQKHYNDEILMFTINGTSEKLTLINYKLRIIYSLANL